MNHPNHCFAGSKHHLRILMFSAHVYIRRTRQSTVAGHSSTSVFAGFFYAERSNMGYIPPDARWYLADIVEEIRVEGDPRNVVHTNLVLVQADSPEEAYEKAVQLGFQGEQCYENPEGKKVTCRYRGLRDLNVIHDELQHGAELTYEEQVDVSEPDIQRWIPSKEELGVFAPVRRSQAPDYASGEVLRELRAKFPNLDA
jgi:Domain of unknown function (DUF4288)